MNPSRIRRCMIELEEIWSKNAEEKEDTVKILQGCENSQPANFVTLLPYTPAIDCYLTRFCGFLQIYPLCNFGSFLVISLVLSIYISSVKLVTSINLSVHQSLNKIGRQVSSPPAGFVIFLSFSFIFFHFITIQTLLDDDKSRDAWLRPLILEEEGHWVLVLR